MSLQFYKFIHLVGLILVSASLAGVVTHAANGGTKAENRLRRPLAAAHGAGLLFILVSGFGMLARLGAGGSLPWWAVVKLVVWLVLGALLAAAYRKPEKAKMLLAVTVSAAALAAWLGLFHPPVIP